MANSAAYVGRIGGLAVALGIGAAIATGQGVAWADEPGSASESAGSAADSKGSAADSQQSPQTSDPTPDAGVKDAGVKDAGATARKRVFGGPRADGPVVRFGNGSRASGVRSEGPRWGSGSKVTRDEPTAVSGAEVQTSAAGNDTKSDPASATPNPARSSSSRGWEPFGNVDVPAVDPQRLAIHTPRPRVLGQLADAVTQVVSEIADAPRAFASSGQMQPAASDVKPDVVQARVVPESTPVAQATPPADSAPTVVTRALASVGDSPLAASDTPTAPASPDPLAGALELIGRELERFFDNKSPSFTYNAGNNVNANGAITGRVVGVDPDDSTVTYTATKPAEGDVVISEDGRFIYTPNADYDGEDSFTVTVSDADSGFHIHGLSGLLNLVTFGLVGESGHTHTETVTVSGAVPPPDVNRTPVITGLTQPTDFRFLPDDPDDPTDPEGRIIIAEKGGAIKVYNGSAMQSEPAITLGTDTRWARGVNGIEVDPEFYDNGYVYVSYIGTDNRERLSRFTVTDPKADVLSINPASEKVLLMGDEPAGDDHHGGEVRYIDGKLYWAIGDNVCCSTIDGSNSQDLSTIYGKVLRINPDGSVPTDNPFYNTPGARQEIYAMGFRNPFRGGVTPDGQLVLGDVGQGTWEEINLVTPGANYGWPYAEGPCPSPGICQPGSAGKTNPIYAYTHDGTSSSITSVMVYEGDAFGPRYENAVFFADFNKGWIKVVNCNDSYTSCGAATTFLPQAGRTSRLLQGPDGSIYQLTYEGTLWRIAPSDPTIDV